MSFRHLLAGLGALLLLSVGQAAHAQPKANSQNVGVCSPKAYANCIQPNADGSINVNGGGGGGGASFTAATSPFAVSAGVNKPAGISRFNSGEWFIPVKPGTTTEIDLTLPSGIFGADGSTIASTSNPVPTQAQTQADTVMIGGVNVKEINGVAPTMGNGTSGTGVQRFAEASDATANANKGQGATAASVPSGAVYEACRGATAAPTAVTDGQLVGALCGVEGKQIMLPYAIKELMVRGSTGAQTGTGAQAFTGISAPAGSLKFYMTGLQCSNTGSTTSLITLNDTATSSFINPAGGGNNPPFLVPLVWAANTAPTANFITSSTSQYCSAQGYTGP